MLCCLQTLMDERRTMKAGAALHAERALARRRRERVHRQRRGHQVVEVEAQAVESRGGEQHRVVVAVASSTYQTN